MTEADAVKALEKLGLVAAVEYVPVDDRALDGIVISQVPIGDGDKLVDPGATVTLQVGRFEGGGGDDGGGNDGGGDEGGGDDGEGEGDRAVTQWDRRVVL
jgi:hypothetical protein